MSLRKKTNEVLEKGEANRGIRQPDAGSVPVRLYNYWAAHTNRNVPERENFCHYWRVVAFWAPLTWLGVKSLDFLGTRGGQASVVALVLLALILVVFSGSSPLGILAIILTGASFALGVPCAGALLDAKYSRDPFLETPNEIRFAKVGSLLGLVGSLPVFVIFYFIRTLVKLIGKVPAPSRRVFSRFVENAIYVLLATAGVALIGLLIVNIWLAVGWWTVLIVGGFVGGLVGIGYTAVTLADRHEAAMEAAREARIEYYVEHGEFPVARKKSTRIGRFFSGVKDVLVFVFQIIRTKKWKICPYVEVPRTEVDAG